VEILIKERDREKSDEEAKANAAVQLKIKVHKITSHCCLRKKSLKSGTLSQFLS
jgi:hypothetical protein